MIVDEYLKTFTKIYKIKEFSLKLTDKKVRAKKVVFFFIKDDFTSAFFSMQGS
jgi:hypothetical protein